MVAKSIYTLRMIWLSKNLSNTIRHNLEIYLVHKEKAKIDTIFNILSIGWDIILVLDRYKINTKNKILSVKLRKI